jgi:hypothetical protein
MHHLHGENTFMIILITQNTHMKILKYPQRQSFFFLKKIFSKVKNVIVLYMKIKKTWNTLVQSLSFFDVEGKKIFLLLRIVKPLVNGSKFC